MIIAQRQLDRNLSSGGCLKFQEDSSNFTSLHNQALSGSRMGVLSQVVTTKVKLAESWDSTIDNTTT